MDGVGAGSSMGMVADDSMGTYSVSSLSSLLEADAVPKNFKPRSAMDTPERRVPEKAPAPVADAGPPKVVKPEHTEHAAALEQARSCLDAA
jgi:hypothetical protein